MESKRLEQQAHSVPGAVLSTVDTGAQNHRLQTGC